MATPPHRLGEKTKWAPRFSYLCFLTADSIWLAGPCSSSCAVPIIRNWTQSESTILSKQETSSFSHLPPIFLQQRESNSCSQRSSQRDGSQSVGWPRKSVPWGACQFVSVSVCWIVEVPRSKPDRATRKEPTGKLSSQDHYLSRKMNSSVAWRSQFLLCYHSKSAVAWLIHSLTLILRSDSPQRPIVWTCLGWVFCCCLEEQDTWSLSKPHLIIAPRLLGCPVHSVCPSLSFKATLKEGGVCFVKS